MKDDRIAIIPASGKGERISSIYPQVKQLLRLNNGLVIDYALRTAKACGAWPHVTIPFDEERVARYVSTMPGPSSFSYYPPGLLRTVHSLYHLFRGKKILYIMSDIAFFPQSIGKSLFDILSDSNGLVCALFHTTEPHKFGMCEVHSQHVIGVQDKPRHWQYGDAAWGLLAWDDRFWHCLGGTKEDNMTEAISAFIEKNGPIKYVWLDSYKDIGTEEDYETALEEGW